MSARADHAPKPFVQLLLLSTKRALQAEASLQSYGLSNFDRIDLIAKFTSSSERESYDRLRKRLNHSALTLWDEDDHGGFMRCFGSAVQAATVGFDPQKVAAWGRTTLVACDDTICTDPTLLVAGIESLSFAHGRVPDVFHAKLHPGVRASHVGRSAGIRPPRLSLWGRCKYVQGQTRVDKPADQEGFILQWRKTRPKDPDTGTHDWAYPFDLCSSAYPTERLFRLILAFGRASDAQGLASQPSSARAVSSKAGAAARPPSPATGTCADGAPQAAPEVDASGSPALPGVDEGHLGAEYLDHLPIIGPNQLEYRVNDMLDSGTSNGRSLWRALAGESLLTIDPEVTGPRTSSGTAAVEGAPSAEARWMESGERPPRPLVLSCPSHAAVVTPTFNRVQDEMSNPIFGLSKADKAATQAQMGELGRVKAPGLESLAAQVAASQAQMGELGRVKAPGLESLAAQVAASQAQMGELGRVKAPGLESLAAQVAASQAQMGELGRVKAPGLESLAAQVAASQAQMGELGRVKAPGLESLAAQVAASQARSKPREPSLGICTGTDALQQLYLAGANMHANVYSVPGLQHFSVHVPGLALSGLTINRAKEASEAAACHGSTPSDAAKPGVAPLELPAPAGSHSQAVGAAASSGVPPKEGADTLPEAEHPIISVLMPVHNGERTVRRAIDSIARQSVLRMGPVQLVVVDDGSTDGTAAVLEECKAAIGAATGGYCLSIDLITLPSKHGVARALNVGLQACRAELVARQDADDVSFLSRLEKQLAFMRRHACISVLGSGAVTFDPSKWSQLAAESVADTAAPSSSHAPPVSCCGRVVSMQPHPVLIRAMLPTECPLLHPTVMFRTTALVSKQAEVAALRCRSNGDGKECAGASDPPTDVVGPKQMVGSAVAPSPPELYPEDAPASEDYALWCEVLANGGRHRRRNGGSTECEAPPGTSRSSGQGDSDVSPPLLAANLGEPLVYLSVSPTSHSRSESIAASRNKGRHLASARCVGCGWGPEEVTDGAHIDGVSAALVGRVLMEPACCSPEGLAAMGDEGPKVVLVAAGRLKDHRDRVVAECKAVRKRVVTEEAIGDSSGTHEQSRGRQSVDEPAGAVVTVQQPSTWRVYSSAVLAQEVRRGFERFQRAWVAVMLGMGQRETAMKLLML